MILRIILIIASYMVGSLSTAIILCRVKYRVDIRTLGSGNAGTTNVLRNFGKKAAGVTLLLDALKGVPCYLLGYFLCHSYGVALACGLAAILGHIFPVWYQFRGGKGVATTLGVALVAAPKITLLALLIALAIMAVSRRVSLGSILGVIAFEVIAVLTHQDRALLLWGICAVLIIIIKHKDNIRWLLSGTEPKFTLKK